jgi:DNA (cytosine-5)-methyltransferase 1
MFEAIALFRPRWIIVENVAGLVTWNDGLVFETVCADLEREDYEVQPFIIPACAVDAPHRRDRVWIVANRSSERRQQKSGGTSSHENEDEGGTKKNNYQFASQNKVSASDTKSTKRKCKRAKQNRVQGRFADKSWETSWKEVALATCHDGVDDGLSRWMDGTAISAAKHRRERLKACGNAIVPQVAMKIMQAIKNAN